MSPAHPFLYSEQQGYFDHFEVGSDDDGVRVLDSIESDHCVVFGGQQFRSTRKSATRRRHEAYLQHAYNSSSFLHLSMGQPFRAYVLQFNVPPFLSLASLACLLKR
jgi:hypothetical protein